MVNYLNKIRTPDNKLKKSRIVINTLLILLLGVTLGVFAKWLDCLSLDDEIWWQHIISVLDLNNLFTDLPIWLFLAVIISISSKSPLRASLNVFLFFLGMNTCYHCYSIHVCGFNPLSYMKMWYIITILSIIPAYICWYAKGNHLISNIIKFIIIIIMFILCCIPLIGLFKVRYLIESLLFIILLFILYKDLIIRRKKDE